MSAAPIPAPAPAPVSAPVAPLRAAAVAASRLVWLGVVGPAAMAASVLTFGESQASSAGRTGMWLLGGGSLVTVLGFLVAGVAVIIWLRQARRNADALSEAPHRLSAGWAVGAWFVPLANLVLPFLVVSDVVKASSAPGERSAAPIVWWTAWVAAAYLVPWCYAGVVFAAAGGAMIAGAIALLLLVELVAVVVAAASFSRIAIRVADQQDERIRALAS